MKIILLSLFVSSAFATTPTPPKGTMDSPYEACKNVLVVDRTAYKKNEANWKKFEQSCKQKIVLADNFEVSNIGSHLSSLGEGADYINFTSKVANKVGQNLDLSRRYAECSASCFAGAKTCKDVKTVQCSDRKKEVLKSLEVNARKAKMALALSYDAPDIIDVNINNVLKLEDKKLINTNLRSFEVGLKNPVGEVPLTEREEKQALRRFAAEKKALVEEAKTKPQGQKWLAVKMMERFEENQKKYRELVYAEAPIFAVIEPTKKYDHLNNPIWDDKQIAEAFKKLAANAKMTQDKVTASVKNGKLEFDRYNGQALTNWLKASVSNKDQHDLLFYTGMANQVEQVLKQNPALCGVATTLHQRMAAKDLQNSGMMLAGTVALSLGTSKVIGKVSGKVLGIGRALTGAESAGLTGLAIGSVYLGDSIAQYSDALDESATKSGLGGDKEGAAIGKGEKVSNALDNVKLSLAFAPIDVAGGWKAGKLIYSALGKTMSQEVPALAELSKRASQQEAARDQLVDSWLAAKVKNAIKNAFIKKTDEDLLKTPAGRKLLDNLVADAVKKDKVFFSKPDNIDVFLKAAVAQLKTEKGDPKDLADKTKSLMTMFSRELDGAPTDLAAKKGALIVFDSAVAELRASFKNDPATYAKFTSNKAAQEKIMRGSLKRLGYADEKEANLVLSCFIR